MTEKQKKTLAVAIGCVLCLTLVVAIGLRYGGNADPPIQPVTDAPQEETEPTVEIEPIVETNSPAVNIVPAEDTADPGTGADDSGTEQTIQADPVRPEAPEPLNTLPEDHSGDDVPGEDRNTETPPAYAPEQTTVTPEPSQPPSDGTGVYVPGFGYIESDGEGSITENENMYENGNQVGIMD